jgi:transaldolase
MVRAVFLDRDGVINRTFVREGKPYPPRSLEEFVILDGVRDACRELKARGFTLVVATNQPDVGRGILARAVVEEMHAEMCHTLPIDRVEVCYDPGGPSDCRKPAPGMLLRAARALDIDLGKSYMVGDRWRDIDCGVAAGCKTIFIDNQYAEELHHQPDFRVTNLLEATRLILEKDTVATDIFTNLKIKIFADGADLAGMCALYSDPRIQGLTTNPTLMRKAGIADYEAFARDVLQIVKDKPISFEVFSDDFREMNRQALKIASWQDNVYVKIPITNTLGESSAPLIRNLSRTGVKLNVTAILTTDQIQTVVDVLDPEVPSVLSIFAGRIADTGIEPQQIVCKSLRIAQARPKAEVLWASVREVVNIFQAEQCGCHIVTVPHDILAKAKRSWGTDLEQLSRETVKMFSNDAAAAGFTL